MAVAILFLVAAYAQNYGSSEKFVSGMMEAIELENEVTLVKQPVGLPQKRLNLVIDALHSAIVDSMLPPGQDATAAPPGQPTALLGLSPWFRPSTQVGGSQGFGPLGLPWHGRRLHPMSSQQTQQIP